MMRLLVALAKGQCQCSPSEACLACVQRIPLIHHAIPVSIHLGIFQLLKHFHLPS